VGSKDNLIALAGDAVWHEIALPDLTTIDWRTAATQMATDLRAMLTRHSRLVQAFGSHMIFGAGKARHDNHNLDVYEAAGAAGTLATTIAELTDDLPSLTIDPNTLSVRVHEILEGTLRFQLTGQDDYGSGTSLATASADVDGTRELLRLLTPALQMQSPGLAATAGAQLDAVQRDIDATRVAGGWPAFADLSRPQREHLDGAVGQVLETLSVVPDLLEVRETE
jgi:hypothetical protein